MKTATISELRENFLELSTWIESGETVRILKDGVPYAHITGVPQASVPPKLVKPDIMARLTKIWGERVFSMAEVEAMRDAERDLERS